MIESFAGRHRRKKISSALLVIAALILPAAPAPAQLLPLDEVAGRVQEIYDRTGDFRANFIQEATIGSLGKTTREEGTIYLKKPERVLWDYTAPSMKKLVINPQKAWLYLPDEQIAYVQDAKEILSSKMTIRFLTGIGRLADDFDMAFPAAGPTDGEGNYRIILTPRGYEAGIRTLLVTVDRETFRITGCLFTDLYGNETRLVFSDIRFNTGPADELFDFTPPPGVKVYTMGRQ